MRREVVLSLVALISACGAPSSSDAGTDAGAGDAGMVLADAGVGDAGTLVGTFQLQHIVSQFGNSSSLYGKVYDGPTPQGIVWVVDSVDGDCRVETPRVPFCATPCGGSAVCVEDNTCQAYPTSKPVGTVRVSGARFTTDGGNTAEFDMTPVVNGYQAPTSVTLDVPPFSDATLVTMTASGSSVVAPFSLTSSGVAPIALTQSSYDLVSGSALELQWTPGSATTAARIEVEIDISHHGGLKGQILCETADDGSLSIGAGLVTKLINLGVAGFPTIVVRRIKTGSTVIAAGRVDLEVFSTAELGLNIPGLVSCTDTSECPNGQTCTDALKCQ